MIDPVRGDNASDGDRFEEAIFFRDIFDLVAIRLFLFALVENFRGHAVRSSKLVFNPRTIRISQARGFIPPRQSSFSPAYITQSRAVFAPPTAQNVLDAGAHRHPKVFQLGGSLIFER